MRAAAPIPVPMHIETTPYLPFVRCSSGIKVAICLEPVHPKGCPKAMAPPFGFNFALLIPSFSTQYVAWLAKASLIYQISTSDIFIPLYINALPVFCKSSGMATAGPIPII